ncbi:hypothetical protein LTR85_003671 [Meristemomyces frigidus]|nr:hypothetical protein LTR85_003671 [Meristemomyces frigidus]
MTMTARTPLDLPPELQVAIIDRIHRPLDLTNVGLSAKPLRSIAVAKLYRSVELDLSRCTYRNLHGFFLAGNPGPKHVQQLVFSVDPKDHSDEAVKVMRLTLVLVARNGLRRLYLPDGILLDEEFFTQLSIEQRHLHVASLGMVGGVVDRVLGSPAFPPDWLQSIICLRVPEQIWSLEDLSGYQKLIERTPALRDLRIRTSKIVTASEGEDLLSESESEEGPLFKTLFRHILGKPEHANMKLDRLVLCNLQLGWPGRSLLKAVDFSVLGSLMLESCGPADNLLIALTGLFKTQPSKLRDFQFDTCVDDPSALQDFLQGISGLHCLHLTYTSPKVDKGFALSSMNTHFPTLRQLCFRASEDEKPKSYELLIKSVSGLRYLSVVMPEIDCIFPGRTVQGAWEGYCTALDAVSRLPELQILRSMNWPRPMVGSLLPPDSQDDDFVNNSATNEINTTRYLGRLDQLANAVLKRIAEQRRTSDPTSLPLLAFGEFEESSLWEEGSETYVQTYNVNYMPALQRSAFGPPEIVGLRVGHKEIDDIVPVTEKIGGYNML